jgi:hypothetical protein
VQPSPFPRLRPPRRSTTLAVLFSSLAPAPPSRSSRRLPPERVFLRFGLEFARRSSPATLLFVLAKLLSVDKALS